MITKISPTSIHHKLHFRFRLCVRSSVVFRLAVVVAVCLRCCHAALIDADSGGGGGSSTGLGSSGGSGNAPIRYKILEELPAGTSIGNLVDDAGLVQQYGPEVVQQLRFRFVSAADAASLPFEIGAIGGALRSTSPVDRDSGTICNKQATHQQQQQLRPSSGGGPSGTGSTTLVSDDVCEVHLSIVVQPVQYLQIIRVIVEVIDVNDNAPRFRETTVHLPINEAAAVGSTYVLPTAIDADGRRYGVRRYELETAAAAAGRFGLTTARKVDGSTDVRLVLDGKLDRESEAQYRLRLVAVDGGDPARSGSVDLVISVTDSNDNRPEFTSAEYQATVAEDAPVGTVVVQVHAIDRDIGHNGEIEYSFAAQTQSLHGSLFGVRNSTGAVYVKGRLDHETSSVYHLIVIGRDLGPDSVASEATVVVHVEDVNDNAPSIVASTLHQQQQQGLAARGGDLVAPVLSPNGATVALVPEDAPPKTFVAHLSVTDPDTGSNGRVNCSLVAVAGLSAPALASTAFTLVRKYATEYQVVTATTLDRERVALYPLTVRCRDYGNEPRTTDLALVVNVIDINDNSPVFSSQTYRGTLMENNYIGMSILQVTATDWDEGNNARIQYSIPGNMAVTFHVDQRGVVSAQDSVDRERYDSFRFPVLAVDQGRPPRTGSALVVIVVGDEDDEKPQFVVPRISSGMTGGGGDGGLGSASSVVYRFNVTENEPAGTRIGTVTAEDRDGSPENSAFVYLFDSGLSNTEEFSVDTHSGTIVTRKPLDRETQSVYRLTVMARPENGNRMSKMMSITGGASTRQSIMSGTTADVFVIVVDQNDNTPTVIFPSRSNRTVHVSTRAAAGHPVARVIARDQDVGDNGRLSYEIVSVVVASSDDDSATDDFISRRLVQYDADDRDGYSSSRAASELFGIDADRGVVFVARAFSNLDLDRVAFDVRVSVVDNGSPPRRASSSDTVALRVIVNASVPYGGALISGGNGDDEIEFDNDYLEENDDEENGGRAGLLGLLTRRAGLIAYITTAVGIGCCLAVAAPIGASVVVRRRRRSRKRKETDDRLQESLRSMLAASDGSCVGPSLASVGDDGMAKTSTATTTLMLSSPETPCSPYYQRNGTTDKSGNGGIGIEFTDVRTEVPTWSMHLTQSPSTGVECCESGHERDSLHSTEGSSVTDSGRGPSEEGGGGNVLPDGCLVGGIRSGSGIRCIPPPPPPAPRVPFPPGQWGPPSTVLHHHHHHLHTTSGGVDGAGYGSTTLPSRQHQNNHQPRSGLTSMSFTVRRNKSSSHQGALENLTAATSSANRHSRPPSFGSVSASTLPPTASSARASVVRFRGLGSTLEEETTDDLVEDSCSPNGGPATSTIVPGRLSTSPHTDPARNRPHSGSGGGTGSSCSSNTDFDGGSTMVTGSQQTKNGPCVQKDHRRTDDVLNNIELIGDVSSGSCGSRPAQNQQQQQQPSLARSGRSTSSLGNGSVVSSCLHGSRSATVQPTPPVISTTSRSFDV